MTLTATSKRVSLLLAFLLLLQLLLLLFIQPANAEDRSFRISEVDIQASIDNKGDMRISEKDTYQFNGAYNGIVVELNKFRSDGIEDFQAFKVAGQQEVPLRTELTGEGDKLQYRVYDPSQNETKVFRFTYTVKNVVQVWADTAELYWKFFDESNPSALETVNVVVDLPDGATREEVTAYGHGPTQGTIQIEDDGDVRFRVSPLSAKQLLEVRVLFPGAYVPGSTRISTEPKLEQIQQEELSVAGQSSDTGSGNETVPFAAVLLLANLVGGIYLKYGQRFGRRQAIDDSYGVLPGDVTPAVVGYLMELRVKSRDLMATMVDLVRKQYVEMQAVKGREDKPKQTNYIFRLLNKENDGLQPHETMLIDWLFGEIGRDDKVSLFGIRKHARTPAHKDAFRKRWSEWQDEVAQAASRLDYVQDRSWIQLMVVLAFVAQFFGFLFFAPEAWKWLMFSSIPLLFLVPRSRRRTRVGELEFRKWKAFKRYLRENNSAALHDPLAGSQWEHHFVYALPLGEAKEMAAATKVNVSPRRGLVRSTLDDSYYYHYMYWNDSFETTLNTVHQSDSSSGDSGSSSSSSSDSGGGGGRDAF
ncbi:DUF2207 domain-containing protein [Paenibacillus koleovorans]|uniref:DUF2207 domain-containing protein n=1 Tax=Paenibacillus koleovorans TaxID=121608 RepID=UPI000FDCAA76|nr:DUF2207 domain-containing protein [Paenibacillus koleovorans]